jgi:antitoxin (DNA-binding transcriptional repressor) of toxin-antitoxin stability system
MPDVIPIYEAKTNFSKLVKRAQAGETIFIGAYGHPEAILAPVPARFDVAFGVWADLKVDDYDYGSIIESDPEIAAEFDAATDRG